MQDHPLISYNLGLFEPGIHWPEVISLKTPSLSIGSLSDTFDVKHWQLPCLLSHDGIIDIGSPMEFLRDSPSEMDALADDINPDAWCLVQGILNQSYGDYAEEDEEKLIANMKDNFNNPINESKTVEKFLKFPTLGSCISDKFMSKPSLLESGRLFEQNAAKQYKYAIKVPCQERLSEADFRRRVPRPVHEWSFQLDAFQQLAIACIEQHQSVLVAAHTSAGKTVVAEYAIRLCLSRGSRVIYTSPIKALSNQKYRDFKEVFNDVGLITGDIQIGQNSRCIIMTTEILRCMLYSRSAALDDLEWVIFDEVHYINDPERGVVWEEVLILLPANVGIILLSATVSNTLDFAEWIGQIKKRPVYVVSTLKRPVPLEHYLYTGTSRKDTDQLFLVVDKEQKFHIEGYTKASNRLHGINDSVAPSSTQKSAALRQQEKQEKLEKGTFKRGGKVNTPGRGHGGSHSSNNRNFSSSSQLREETQWLAVIDLLQQQNKLPAVVFLFSKKRINQLVGKLKSVELLSKSEQHRVRVLTQHWIAMLREEDRLLPQIVFMKELLYRGVACHHSGILPLLKEMVELLFQFGLVKLLFATETFAMGVNMPTRTVLFDALRKHDGTSMRYLNPSEYTQMAGRAGRRGLDPTGTVILVLKPDPLSLPTSTEMQKVMLGRSAALESRFRLTYTMLLNLHRSHASKVEDMMRYSFIQAGNLRSSQTKEQRLSSLKKEASSTFACDKCNQDGVHSIYEGIQGWLRLHHQCVLGVDESNNSATTNLSQKIIPCPLLQSSTLDAGRPILFSSYPPKRVVPGSTPTAGCLLRLGLWLKPGRNAQSHLILTYSTVLQTVMPSTFNLLSNIRTDQMPDFHMVLTLLLGDVVLQQNDSMAELVEISSDQVCFIFSRVQRLSSQDEAKKEDCDLDFALTKMEVEDIVEDFRRRQMERFLLTAVSAATDKAYGRLSELMTRMTNRESPDGIGNVECLRSLSPVNWLKEAAPSLQKDTQLLPQLQEWTHQSQLIFSKSGPYKYLLEEHHEICSELYNHLLFLHNAELRSKEISQLHFLLSDRNLAMLPDYEAKVRVLQRMEYLSLKGTVRLKGLIACELGLHELTITELLLQGTVRSLKPSELAALFSCFVYEKGTSADASFEDLLKGMPTDPLRTLVNELTTIASKIGMVERECGASQSSSSMGQQLNFGLCPQVYAWAEGYSFGEVMKIGEELRHRRDYKSGESCGPSPWPEPEEGVFVRCMQRLDELLRHVRAASKVIGNPDLEDMAQNASMAIRRDVIFAPSLYTLVETKDT